MAERELSTTSGMFDYAFTRMGQLRRWDCLGWWWHATRQQSSRGRTMTSSWSAESLPVLDFRELNDGQMSALPKRSSRSFATRICNPPTWLMPTPFVPYWTATCSATCWGLMRLSIGLSDGWRPSGARSRPYTVESRGHRMLDSRCRCRQDMALSNINGVS